MKGLRARRRSIASAAALTAAVLGGGASCRTAQPYLDPRGPVFAGAFALAEAPLRERPRGPGAEVDPGRRLLHVVTFNVEYALRVDQALRALRENEHLRGADLIALQEMDAPGTDAIARGLGLNYVYYPASVHPKYGRDVGNAILTPWPIERTFKLPLPHRSRVLGQARLAAGAMVRVAGRRLRVYSVHLGSPLGASPGQRRDQIQVVLCDAQDSPDPVVIAGDFNSKGLGARLVEAGYLWPTRDVGPTTRRFSFDHVFVRGLPLQATRAGVAREVKDASDHHPVWAELSMTVDGSGKLEGAAQAEDPLAMDQEKRRPMSTCDLPGQVSRAVSVSCFLAVLAPAAASAQEPPPRPFLREVIRLDDAQLAAVDKGEVVTKLLPSPEKVEIAAFGIVRTAGTPERLLSLARDIQKFRKVPQIPEMGRFSNPATLGDLKGLTHPPDDIAALKKCKPGSCDVKLGTKGLQALSRFDWSAPDAEQRAVTVFNQAIVDYVNAYQQGGTEAMGNVVDKKQEKSRAVEYRTLLANSPYLVEYVKEFNDYLAAYPKGKLAGAEDVLFWAKDTFGLKPVVSGYHATSYLGPRGVLISSKLLAASHYFNASLEIIAGVPTPDGKGLYLLSLFRTRIDPPTGMLAGILMGKVRDGVETGVKENLKTARERLAAAP